MFCSTYLGAQKAERESSAGLPYVDGHVIILGILTLIFQMVEKVK